MSLRWDVPQRQLVRVNAAAIMAARRSSRRSDTSPNAAFYLSG
jgi:hypothetical protein